MYNTDSSVLPPHTALVTLKVLWEGNRSPQYIPQTSYIKIISVRTAGGPRPPGAPPGVSRCSAAPSRTQSSSRVAKLPPALLPTPPTANYQSPPASATPNSQSRWIITTPNSPIAMFSALPAEWSSADNKKHVTSTPLLHCLTGPYHGSLTNQPLPNLGIVIKAQD